MAESSGPISVGTTAERQFTDVQWRSLFGDEPGIVGDMDGSSYAITLGPTADTITVGSATQASEAKVAGFQHRIPSGAPVSMTIPAAVGSTRTDLIALRYDPSFTGAPGPVRLVRIAGSSSAIPAYDASPPGIEELPLFAITRAVGGLIAAATVTRVSPRIGPVIDLPVGVAQPTSSPLGSILRQGVSQYHRRLVSTTPTWVQDENRPRLFKRQGTPGTTIVGGGANETGIGGVTGLTSFTLTRAGVFLIRGTSRGGTSSGGSVATFNVKVDGALIGYPSVERSDGTMSVQDVLSLSAGSHTIAARLDNNGSIDIQWTNFMISLIEGVGE